MHNTLRGASHPQDDECVNEEQDAKAECFHGSNPTLNIDTLSEEVRHVGTNYRMFHRNLASRNPPLKTDHHQNVHFRLPSVVTIGLNTWLEPSRPLEKKLVKVDFWTDLKMPSTVDHNCSPVSNDSPLSRPFTLPARCTGARRNGVRALLEDPLVARDFAASPIASLVQFPLANRVAAAFFTNACRNGVLARILDSLVGYDMSNVHRACACKTFISNRGNEPPSSG
jgi:hypothetical protein